MMCAKSLASLTVLVVALWTLVSTDVLKKWKLPRRSPVKERPNRPPCSTARILTAGQVGSITGR